MSRSSRSRLALLAVLALAGCGDTQEPGTAEAAPQVGSPNARPELVEELRESQRLAHDPSDGGGRAWLEPEQDGGPPFATVGAPDRFVLVYEVGPLGIATGGAIHLQVSPFWDWSTPQVEWEEGPGFTTVEADAPDVELEAGTLDQQLLGIEVTGRALRPGELVRIVYGAGPAGAIADRYAERASRFWFAVDGDGDGTRLFLADSPTVEVRARGPARLVLTVPTVVRAGESFPLTLAVLDAVGDTGVTVEGDFALEFPPGLELPEQVHLEPGDRGLARVEGRVAEPGVFRVKATGPYGLAAEANPLVVSDGPRVLWGDLHGHSNFSDGTGVPEDYYRYARDVAALDVASLTDHDHWGILKLDERPELFEEIQRQTQRFYEPGRFVTLVGYEWTNWIYGHRHVLFFENEGEVLSSLDERFETPQQLWAALQGRPVLTFAHHSAGDPIATDWSIPPDPVLEPLTEIVSVHGSSEAPDSPGLISGAIAGNFVRDALSRGYTLGFVGSGDTHDGHPGLGHLNAPSGGLAAILAEERTRESVLAALRARRVYATNGARILLRTALGPYPMGSVVEAPEGGLTDSLFVRVVAEGPLEHVDVIRSGDIVEGVDAEGRLDLAFQVGVPGLVPGEYVYVRAVQENGFAAWSSPIFVR